MGIKFVRIRLDLKTHLTRGNLIFNISSNRLRFSYVRIENVETVPIYKD